MLQVRSIAKRFGSFEMSNVNLTINDGEYFVLLGPSGVGKTVLMEIIAGLIRPDEGRILWDGEDIASRPPEADYALFPHLTVKQNIAFGLEAAGAGTEKIHRQQTTLSEILHIERLLDRYPATMSGGEKQRVALARALAVEPRLLLLDEPLGVGVLHITHDPLEAIALGDHIGVMLDGTIRQVARACEIFRRPCDLDVARFLGMRNILHVDRVQGDACLVCGQKIFASAADDSTRHIWVKPEEILLSSGPFDSSARNQFKCRVSEITPQDTLLAVQVDVGEMTLTALITHRSFDELGITEGSEVWITFKSSAVHCF